MSVWVIQLHQFVESALRIWGTLALVEDLIGRWDGIRAGNFGPAEVSIVVVFAVALGDYSICSTWWEMSLLSSASM